MPPMMFQWDAVDISSDMWSRNVLQTFQMATGPNRRTTWTELEINILVLVLLARKLTARCCCSIALLSAFRSHHRLRMRILWILKIRRIHHFLWIYEANVLTQLAIKGNSVVMSAKRQHWPASRPTLCHKMSILVSCAKGTFMASYFMTYFYVL